MNLFDKLVHALFQFDGSRMQLVSGNQVMVSTPRGERSISVRPVTPQQIANMLREIVPNTVMRDLSAGRAEFDYASPNGRVHVLVSRDGATFKIDAAPIPDVTPGEALFDRPRSRSISAIPAVQKAPAVQPAPAPPPAAAPEPAPAPPPDLLVPHRFDEQPQRLPSRVLRAPHSAQPIDKLFRTMVEQNCSDLHLTSNNPPLYRKDGDIVPLGQDEVLTQEQVRDFVWPITPPKNREEFEECNDTDFAYEIPGLARFRCNLFADRHGIGGVFRVIPADILTVDKLNLSRHVIDLCHLPKGLVLVTGPTGSGKSTTLAALIDYINSHLKGHIITIEDPIEFVHPTKNCLINQREVGVHTQGFKRALRAALREDPDIVLVGELRDLETVHIAIETAETGHLVFGTLHTNTAPSTVDRLIDQFPADRQSQIRTMLSESLKGVIAQTLCKKKGGGRIAAYEILIVNRSVANLIREGKTFQIPSIMQTGRSQGMTTLNQALIDLVQAGKVDAEEAYHRSVAKAELKQAFTQLNIHLEAE